jgi:hypothetical protein
MNTLHTVTLNSIDEDGLVRFIFVEELKATAIK